MVRSSWVLLGSLCIAGCAELANLDAYGSADPAGGGGASSGSSGGASSTSSGGSSTTAGGGGATGGSRPGGCGGDACAEIGCADYATLLCCHGAVAHWPLDEQSGTIAEDVIDGHHGSYIGGTAQGYVGAFGYSFEGDGTGTKYVTIPNGDLDYGATGEFTVELWFKTSDLDQGSPGRGMFSHFDDGVPQSGWALTLVDFTLGIAHVEAQTSVGASEHTTAVTVDEWHHLVGVFKSMDSVLVYLDGDPANPEDTSSSLGPVAENLLLGCRRDTSGAAKYCFDGRIDEVAIYDYALSSDQISSHVACRR